MPLKADGPLVRRLCRWRCRYCGMAWHYSYHPIEDVQAHLLHHPRWTVATTYTEVWI